MMNVNLDKFTDKGQYKVPEGYFDTLADRIMANIPEPKAQKKKQARIISIFKVKYAVAACFIAAIIGGAAYQFNKESENVSETLANTSATYGEEYVNDYIDYAMVDGNDIYEYLSEN